MTNPARLLNRMMNRAGARLRDARPGSVLILVIALLVLMALIGTAFITTARVDRYSATQNTYNTQVDLLVQGVLGMAEGPVVQKLEGSTGTWRQGVSTTVNAPAQYNPWESPITELYLTDRVPSYVIYNGVTTATLSNGTSYPGWANITTPLNANISGPTGQFESPYAVDSAGNPVIGPVTWYQRNNLIPTSIAVPQPDGSVRQFPAFGGVTPLLQASSYQSTSPSGTVTFPLTVLAADTDGDGIADAGYIRMPMGQLEGATYYGAVRIIDNLAAINASVAMEPYTVSSVPTAATYAVPGNFFPININLRDLASANGDAMSALNGYRRFGTGTWTQPVDDYGNARSDFAFNTPYEAAWNQLGCRLNNPGFLGSGQYQAVPISEGLNLAYHGGLVNINAPAASPVLETYLPKSVYNNPNVNRPPFPPGGYTGDLTDTNLWFNTIYNYASPPSPLPLRPLLVVRNPVSSFVPNYFSDQGFYPTPSASTPTPPPTPAYGFGSSVQYRDPNTSSNPRAFVCIQPMPANANQPPMSGTTGTTYNNAYWAAMPWASAPTKINANTGTFGQLWMAYWSVMQDSPDYNRAYPSATSSGWQSTGQSDTDPGGTSNKLAFQFRSSIRNTTSAFLTRTQMIQLRAALAAVNTIDMRDGDEDVTSRTIALTDVTGLTSFPHTLYANVYGAEKQPYITEVLIDYEPNPQAPATPPTPYVAIEIYNPHPTPILLSNWKLAYITSGAATITLTEVGDFNTTLKNASRPTPYAINPGERIVLQNQTPAPTNISTAYSSRSPTVTPITNYPSAGTTNLENAVGHELVLLRSRTAYFAPPQTAPPLTKNSAPENVFDESSLYDLVPLDNIDLTGVAYDPTAVSLAPTVPSPPPQRYRYARANKIKNDSTSAAWHCVFPGPYDPTQMGGKTGMFHEIGLVPVLAYDIPAGTPGYPPGGVSADDGYLGLPKDKFAGKPTMTSGSGSSQFATYDTRPMQINNRDSAGPNRPYYEMPENGAAPQGSTPNGTIQPNSVTNGGPMSLPLGGFARNGDLLEVPFIGSYRITTGPDSGNTLEMNSITIDSVYAQFQAPAYPNPVATSWDVDNSVPPTPLPPTPFHNELIGHFCPMTKASTDFNDDPNDTNFSSYIQGWTYHWAKRLFDYVDVRSPQDAFLPNVDPAQFVSGAVGVSSDPSIIGGSTQKYPIYGPTYNASNPNVPAPIPSNPSLGLTITPPTANAYQQLQGRQDTSGTEGLININTASVPVLAAIPWYTPTEDPAPGPKNLAIAQAIVTWRDTLNTATYPNAPHTDYGPFRSIFDLLKVPAVSAAATNFWAAQALTPNNTAALTPGEVGNASGDLSPFAPTFPMLGSEQPATPGEGDLTDHVFGDVKTRFLFFSRFSNLITTRSDSFTVYAQVQGWQNIGTATPTLVATRRAAAFLDRTQVVPLRNPSNPTVVIPTPIGVINVPND